MSRFLDPLRIEQVGWRHGRPVWITLWPLRYESTRLGAIVVIPADFITDLASTPRWLVTWFLAGGRAPRPSVVHDYPYQAGEFRLIDGDVLPVTRSQTDSVFHEAMVADPISGTDAFTRAVMWSGVRLGGRGVWADDERSTALNPVWSATEWPGRVEA